MDEDAGVKVPVTRLRRRLSIEQSEESKSPAPNTPTTRRVGRKVAKPELDLIEENAQEDNTQGKSKKTLTKDIIDEEKLLTPSRRSTRIRSNTSIVSETLVTESPRAKRATKRTSQVGSDNEAPVTPARLTRRTRKDSASSIDKVENQYSKQGTQITKAITEEPETVSRKSSSKTEDIENKLEDVLNESPNSPRKSPRLLEKKDRRSTSTQSDTDRSTLGRNNIDSLDSLENLNSIDKNLKNTTKDELVAYIAEGLKSKKNKNKELSLSSCNLIENIDTESKIKITNMNKSTSSLLNPDRSNTKRSRSKSFTNVQDMSSSDSKFLSDNESMKKKIKQYIRLPLKLLNKSGSGDGVLNNSRDKLNKSLEKKSNQKFVALINNEKNILVHDKEAITGIDADSNDDHISNDKNKSSTSAFFRKDPTGDLQTTVLIEDSDSNSEKLQIVVSHSEDQCVPEIQQATELSNTKSDSVTNLIKESPNFMLNKSKDKSIVDDTCEPMDVDETIQGSLIISGIQDEQLPSSIHKYKTNVSLHTNESNKSKRKSSISQSLDKSENQNKSTLILSQLKDISTNDINDQTKSLQNSSKRLSKSTDRLNITQENAVNKKILTTNYTTSTPLQASKSTKELKSHRESLNEDNIDKATKNQKVSDVASVTSEESSQSGDETSHSNLLDIEAEDAGDDYESGDSQNEDEIKYEKDHEILEKGETLSSNDELSNDSDYEKDSFVVSSDEQDNELLDGSDDDLSMSDNELKMTSKSKKKYNERKQKEQKKASREMYESRHKFNKSNDNKCHSDLSETEEIITKPKKKNRRRLDSSHDVSNIDGNDTSKHELNKILTETECNESVMKEVEITCYNESYMKTDPLATTLIKEDLNPTKDINETLAFIDADNINETKVEVKSKRHSILDPLEATKGDDDDDSSLSSDNEIIMQNYDSVLDQLNKSKKQKINNLYDMSLNLDKKTKKKEKKSVVDELNLTYVKSTMKSKRKGNDHIYDDKKDKPVHEDNSSDSIDLHLLFSEDSSNNEEVQSGAKEVTIYEDKFIPLKKADGRTNIREEQDLGEEAGVHFFIDTKGTYGPDPYTMKSLETSCNSVKNKSKMLAADSDSDAPMEISFKSDKNKSRNTSINLIDDGSADNVEIDRETEKSFNASVVKTPGSGKKKKKNKLELQNDVSTELCFDTSTGSSKKKKKISMSEENAALKTIKDDNVTVELGDVTSTASAKKIKKVSESEANISINAQKDDNIPIKLSDVISTASAKKKKNVSISEANASIYVQKDDNISIELSDVTATASSKKKKNISIYEANTSINVQKDDDVPNKQETSTSGSKKKQKKVSLSEANISANTVNDVVSIEQTSSMNKKQDSKKKQKKISESNIDNEIIGQDFVNVDGSLKKNLALNFPKDGENTKEDNYGKRKRKFSETTLGDTLPKDNNNDKDIESISNIKKKKQKLKHKSEHKEPENVGNEVQIPTQSSISKKSIKGDKLQTAKEQIHLCKDKTEITIKNKNKKRKEREDDDDKRSHKVLKGSSFGNLHITRLPPSVLEHLDDVTKLEEPVFKKSKIIATTEFLVEETMKRKNKPSKYLEESIYLNDEDLDMKKRKHSADKPKLLPFVPTALTSNSGYTTNFKVNVIPSEIKFVAKSSTDNNFKNDHLYNKKIKRLGTYDLYKRNRNIKISKF